MMSLRWIQQLGLARIRSSASAVLGYLLQAQRSLWIRRKHGFAWRVPRIVTAGIRVTRQQSSPFLANTSCTMLLAHSAPASQPAGSTPT